MHHADIEYTQDSIPNEAGTTNGYTRLSLNFEKRVLFQNKITGIVRAMTGFTFVDNLQSGDISFINYGYGANYFIGGVLERPRVDDHTLRGLQEAELVVTQFMMLNLGVQFNPLKNIYLTPHVNLATVGHDDFTDYIQDAFSPGGNWSTENETSGIFSTGVTASYKSILGPVDLDISWANDINKVRVFFAIGYQFNRSK